MLHTHQLVPRYHETNSYGKFHHFTVLKSKLAPFSMFWSRKTLQLWCFLILLRKQFHDCGSRSISIGGSHRGPNILWLDHFYSYFKHVPICKWISLSKVVKWNTWNTNTNERESEWVWSKIVIVQYHSTSSTTLFTLYRDRELRLLQGVPWIVENGCSSRTAICHPPGCLPLRDSLRTLILTRYVPANPSE